MPSASTRARRCTSASTSTRRPTTSPSTAARAASWVQPARPELLLERLATLKGQIADIVYEAGPTGFSLARKLLAEGLPAQVIATSKVLAPVGQDPCGGDGKVQGQLRGQMTVGQAPDPVRAE